MIRARMLIAATLLASIAATSCGGSGGGPSKPSNPVVTVRFIGPDGGPFSPSEVILLRPVAGVSYQKPMHTWDDGTCTDLGVEPLIPGEVYDVDIDPGGRRGVFAYTTIRFTAQDDRIDLGTFDLRPLGLTLTSPAPGAVATSYPVEFTWTAYANPAATYEPLICAERIGNGNGCVDTSASHATSYSLGAATKAESIQGRAASWQMMVYLTTPEGYEVTHSTEGVGFTLPD